MQKDVVCFLFNFSISWKLWDVTSSLLRFVIRTMIRWLPSETMGTHDRNANSQSRMSIYESFDWTMDSWRHKPAFYMYCTCIQISHCWQRHNFNDCNLQLQYHFSIQESDTFIGGWNADLEAIVRFSEGFPIRQQAAKPIIVLRFSTLVLLGVAIGSFTRCSCHQKLVSKDNDGSLVGLFPAIQCWWLDWA